MRAAISHARHKAATTDTAVLKDGVLKIRRYIRRTDIFTVNIVTVKVIIVTSRS